MTCLFLSRSYVHFHYRILLSCFFLFGILTGFQGFSQNSFPSTGNVTIGNSTTPNSLTVFGPIITGQVQANSLAQSYTDVFSYQSLSMQNYGQEWVSDPWQSGGGTLWASGWNGIKFFTRESPKLCITPSGNVGIGTMAPQSLLAVAGAITAQKVTVTLTGWSDFVFEPSYKLTPLQDVKSYILQYKHLPGISSEDDIKANGLELGLMEKIQMQKIEELTLYAIDADKKILEQQARLDKLTQALSLLEEKVQRLR